MTRKSVAIQKLRTLRFRNHQTLTAKELNVLVFALRAVIREVNKKRSRS